MNKIEFIHQNYWLRVFSLIPLLFILAFVEYSILSLFIENLNSIVFFAVSLIIMYMFVNIVYPRISLVFLKHDHVEFTNKSIIFVFNQKKYIFNVDDIKDININKIKIYGVEIAQLVLSLENVSKKEVVLYSEDLDKNEIKQSSLYPVYQNIRKLILK